MEDGLITTKEVGNYRIKIYYDTDSACPCESWDMAACFLWECIYLPRLQDVCDWREVFGKYGDSRHSLIDALHNFIRYSEMKNWSVRELFGEDLEQADRALINKVYHMLFDIGSDFESVIRMLYSFRNGPKSGIKVADPEDNYEWTNKDGNEKYSTKNLPKAHFRWDWGRYTLSKESVDKITEFVDAILKS